MKKLFIVICILMSIKAFGQNTQTDYSNKITGYWQGVLTVNGTNIHIIFEFRKDKNDSLTAKLNVTEQGAKNIIMSSVFINANNLTVKSKTMGLNYEGIFISDSMKIKGMWIQNGVSLPLDLLHTDNIINKTVNHPQEPKAPFPYIQEEVTFESVKGIKLAGTLTYPSTGENYTTVVMVSGSGSQDRNEELLGHKPFLVISDYLSREVG